MSNEMKLIEALCEALGFQVNVHLDYKEQTVSETEGHMIIHAKEPHPLAAFTLVGVQGSAEYERGAKGSYVKRLIKPEISYTVEKQQ